MRTTSSTQKPGNPNLARTTEKKTENSVAPPTPGSNGSTLLAAVTKLNNHLTTLHAALPPGTSLPPCSGHSDGRSMLTLAARRTECSEAETLSTSSVKS
ncbi:hypothetical protein V8E53_000692 [Lactarius tabidus]